MRVKIIVLKLMKILSESILPIFFWLFLIFGFDVPYIAILTVIAAIIHESGHIAAISVLSANTEIPQGHISGFKIKRAHLLTYFEEGVILAMGPIFNLIAFAISLPFANLLDGYIGIFGIINLLTALSNLIPVEGYDGYGVLKQLCMATGKFSLIKLLDHISFLFSVCATFFSLYVIDKFGSGYWIFGVFFAIMMSKLIKYGKYDVF